MFAFVLVIDYCVLFSLYIVYIPANVIFYNSFLVKNVVKSTYFISRLCNIFDKISSTRHTIKKKLSLFNVAVHAYAGKKFFNVLEKKKLVMLQIIRLSNQIKLNLECSVQFKNRTEN